MCVDTKRDLYVFASEYENGAVVRVEWDATSGIKDCVLTREAIMDVAYSETLDRYYVAQLKGREIMVFNAQHMVVQHRLTPDIDPTDFPIDLGHGFPFYVSTGIIKARPIIVVNDYHDGSICVIDAQNDRLEKRYGEYGTEDNEMINPMTAAVDHAGRLIVVDGIGRLMAHWSDTRGDHYKCLMTEESCARELGTNSPPLAIDIDPVHRVMGVTFSDSPDRMRIILYQLE